MSILTILNEIGSISGTNDKIAALKKHATNETLKQVLFLTLDPNTSFGMKKVPDYFVNEGASEADLDVAFTIMDKLASRELTGNNAILAVSTLLGKLSAEDAEVISRMLRDNLQIGMDVKNVNKAIGSDFLKETPYMRCGLTTEKTLKKIKYPAVSEVKMDGQYLNHFVRNGSYYAESRNGKPYDFLGVMDDAFLELAKILETDFNIINPVLNGEAVVSDGNGGVLPRTTGNGIIQKFGKDTGNIIDAENVIAVVWDVLPYEDYRKGEWKVKRKDRREILEAAINKLSDANKQKIKMIEYKVVNNFAEAHAYNTEVMARGDEGTILKDERGLWKFHTSPMQLKMKLKFRVDMRVVGFEEGKADGKNVGSLGALIVESECGQLRCRMGTGFKELFCPKKDIGTDKEYGDEDVRQYIWDNQDMFMGKIVEGESNDILLAKDADFHKLFLPAFKHWRFDKDEADTLERMFEIKETAILSMTF